MGSLTDVTRSRPSASADSADTSARARKVRVLIVAPSIRYLGGQAIQAGRLHKQLSLEDWIQVDLLPVDPKLPAPFGWMQRVKYLRTVVTSVAYVASLLLRVGRYDVIHAFSASYWSFLLAPVPALLVGRLFRKRVLINYRSGEADDHLTRWGWHAIPLLRLAHTVVVPSGYLVEVFARHGITAVPLPNFLELAASPYRQREPLRPALLSNRNFEALYNVADILRAFAEVQIRHRDASLMVVGDGPQKQALHELSTQLGLRNVVFTGPVAPSRMGDCYAACDIYVNTPTIDNMPNSVLEAFAAGLPVATSDAGGIPYIVRNGENGLLVPCRDKTALANAVLSLLADPLLARRLAAQARSDVLSRYTWDVVRDQWRTMYTAPGLASA